MNIKVDEITIRSDCRIYIEVLVPKKRPSITRFDGTKSKPYTFNERYRIIIGGKRLYVEYHCIKDGWDSYPNPTYAKIKKWWKLNKRSVKNNMIKKINNI